MGELKTLKGEEKPKTKTEKGYCDEHGEYESHVYEIKKMGLSLRTGCPICYPENEEIDDDDYENLFRSSGIPQRFVDSEISNFTPGYKKQEFALKAASKYVQNWNNILKNGTSLIFCGSPGTGKTHLSISIMKEILRLGFSAKYIQARKMTREVKQTYSGGSEILEIERFVRPQLLIIDEVGKQFDSDSERGIMFEILNDRYNNMKPTILISNMNKNSLEEFLGIEIVDRICEGNGLVIDITGESYRRK